jgi:prolyl-tRNA synthetase
MRVSQLFGQTLRAAPADAEVTSHALLLRAGYIRPVAAGIYSLLPLGVRTVQRIERIVRAELDAIGGQEISLPVVQPAEPWIASGRWDSIDETLVRFEDRRGRSLALALTAEEAAALLAASETSSYRDLPRIVYQIQTKFRDEARPRAGLLRTREFTMNDSYSLGRDRTDLERAYADHAAAYFRIADRVGVPVVAVLGAAGDTGGDLAHELTYLNDAGEDLIVRCPAGDYAANREAARTQWNEAPALDAPPTETVATPGRSTIEDVAAFLGIEPAATGKAMFYVATDGRVVVLLVRGDRSINEVALAHAMGAFTPADDATIAAIGAVPGYGSPVGVTDEATVLVDRSVLAGGALVVGANRVEEHLRHAVAGRDYRIDDTVDVTTVEPGDPCPRCGTPLTIERGIEYGNIFQFATRYSDALGVTFKDEGGDERPVHMGSYGIGIGRLLACIVEEHHDERGLVLPATVSPFDVAVVPLGTTGEVMGVAERLAADPEPAGLTVLLDDRDARPGVKFADAELRGMPLRVTVSERSLTAGGVEVVRRAGGETEIVPVPDAVAGVHQIHRELLGALVPAPDAWTGDPELLSRIR